MLAGLSARRYRAGSEPVGEIGLHGTSRSSISRRFRRATEARLAELFGRDLSGLCLLAVFIDGMHVGGHLNVVALGVDEQGRKHALGLWQGTTENKSTCSALIDNLIDRGLPEDRALLFVIDGGKAIRRAIASHWGELALVQRCRQHKAGQRHRPSAARGAHPHRQKAPRGVGGDRRRRGRARAPGTGAGPGVRSPRRRRLDPRGS
jgi:putative transposase